MEEHVPGSKELSRLKPVSHHYKKHPDEDYHADKALELVVQELMAKRGLTREAALKAARHWV